MTKNFVMLFLTLFCVQFIYAQKEKTEKKSAKEVLQELPEKLIAQPDNGPDTNANKLISDNMTMVINPVWKTEGTLTFTDFKLPKTNKDPLAETMPIPDKDIVQAIAINMGSAKKSATDKKQAVLNQVKSHLTTYFKDAGTPLSGQELTDKVNGMVLSQEDFTTDEGRSGQLYLINDIQSQQSNFIVLLILGDDNPSVTHTVLVQYTRYTYETTLPEDPLELKTFVYADEQSTYVDFTKKMLKTVHIQ